MSTGPTPERESLEQSETTARIELASAGAWNLGLNVLGKVQTLVTVLAGTFIGGLAGVGILATAIAGCFLGGAIADFGLTQELGRLSVTHRTRATVKTCARALARRVPLAALLAPLVFYLALGRRYDDTLELLPVIGLLAAALMGTFGLTAVFNGLGDFRTPALRLGAARLVGSLGAVAGALLSSSPTAVLGAFLVAEVAGFVVLAVALRHRYAELEQGDPAESRVKRAHLWLGASSVSNVLTNQSDTLLVASILSPSNLGMFSIASLLGNGVGTTALSSTTPAALHAVRAALAGGAAIRRLRHALAVGAIVAPLLAAATWVVVQLAGSVIPRLAALTSQDGKLVLGFCLAAAVLATLAGVHLVVGVGIGRHRSVGLAGIVTGCFAAVCITVGALLFGVVGAGAGTLARDGFLLLASVVALAGAGYRATVDDSARRPPSMPHT